MSALADLKPAVIYCRVSDGKGGRRGDGLRSQETSCRQFAKFAGYSVDAVFTDDITGSVTDRKGMMALVKFLKAHRDMGYTVLIDAIDRFARDVRGHWDLRDLLREAGGKLASPKMEFKDDADSMMVENIHATFAQHFRQKNAEQTLGRMKARLLNGYFVFQAPVGYKYHTVTGQGRVLKPDEPAASVVREALEGYASGRFENQADVMRFLQGNPLFPKDATGMVRHNRVGQLLRNPTYAGYVEAPNWNITLRKGQHEPLISFETFQRIQDRINGATYAPRRRNLNSEFPLRGFIYCQCGTPLTACWSKSRTGARHAYYLCPNKKGGCPDYGKSIKRDVLEGEFETLLQSLTPSETLFRVATRMFKDLWDRRLSQVQDQGKALRAKLAKVEQDTAKLLERILDASLPSVITAYENRIETLEKEKLLIAEKITESGKPKLSYDQTLRTALAFLSNPRNLWDSGQLEMRRTVLKLAFGSKLEYRRNEGLRTPNLALPFKVLGQISGGEKEMARPKRFELLTPRFVVWCSIQLSYGRAGRRCGRLCGPVRLTLPIKAGQPIHGRPDHCKRVRAIFVEASCRFGAMRQGDVEPRAALRVHQSQNTPMRLDDFPRDGEAKAGATGSDRPFEGHEEVIARPLRQAGAIVRDRNHRLVRTTAGAHDDARLTSLRPTRFQCLACVLDQVDQHPAHLACIDLHHQRVIDFIAEVDQRIAGGFRLEGRILHQPPEGNAGKARRGRGFTAIVEHRLGKADRAIQGVHQARRQPLHLGVIKRCHLIRKQLCRCQRIAQIMIDLGHRQAEIGQVPALAQHGKEITLHFGQLALQNADLVAPPRRIQDKRRILRSLAESQHIAGHAQHRIDEQPADQHIKNKSRDRGNAERDQRDGARIVEHVAPQRRLGHQQFDQTFFHVAGPDDAKGSPGTGEQCVECSQNLAGQVAQPKIGRHHHIGHDRIGQFDHLALAFAPIDNGMGAGRIEQPVRQFLRQGHDVRNGIENPGGHHADSQPVLQPGRAEAGERGQVDHDLDEQDDADDRRDQLARKAGEPAGHDAGQVFHRPDPMSFAPRRQDISCLCVKGAASA
jgi:site-specific DNA recombinase